MKSPPPRYLNRHTPNANRVGVRLNGEDRPGDVVEYNVKEGWCRVLSPGGGTRLMKGTVEPYWRPIDPLSLRHRR